MFWKHCYDGFLAQGRTYVYVLLPSRNSTAADTGAGTSQQYETFLHNYSSQFVAEGTALVWECTLAEVGTELGSDFDVDLQGLTLWGTVGVGEESCH